MMDVEVPNFLEDRQTVFKPLLFDLFLDMRASFTVDRLHGDLEACRYGSMV